MFFRGFRGQWGFLLITTHPYTPFISVVNRYCKTWKLKIKVWIVLLFAATFALTACNRYSAESTEGWVIDADTKKPIEGVIVVANWQLHKSTMGGKRPADHLNIMETTTDNDGLFYFEGWGQKTALWGFFIDRDAELLFYKKGYEYRSLKNTQRTEIDTSKVRQSAWNGKKIELKRFDGHLREYASHLSSLHTSVRSIFHGMNVNGKERQNSYWLSPDKRRYSGKVIYTAT